MNHFLLPGRGEGAGGDTVRYGVHAMELLVNGLLREGARRERLEAKLFGGARMLEGLTDIGTQNAEFAKYFLQRERIAFTGVLRELGVLGADIRKALKHSGAAERRAKAVPADVGSVELF